MVWPYYVNEASVYAVAVIFPVLCTGGVVLRFLQRKQRKAGYGADDWMSIIALILLIWLAIILIYGDAEHTIGWHSPTNTQFTASLASEGRRVYILSILEWVFILTSVLATGAVRMIFALLYRRIFNQDMFKVSQIVNWVLIVSIVVWTITFFFANLFQCGTHFYVLWTSQADYAKYCPGSFDIAFAMALSDVVIDLALLITPIYRVMKLQMRTGQKILMVAMFATGIFSIAAGFTRLVLVGEVLTYPFGSTKPLFGLAGTADQIGIVSVEIWWTFMEIGVGMLVSQLPVAWGVLIEKVGKPLSSLRSWMSLKTSSSAEVLSMEEGKSKNFTSHSDRSSE